MLIMATYLAISLITSLVLNIYNKRVQFIER
jgi:ABC-type amino acid transport system permease subunit